MNDVIFQDSTFVNFYLIAFGGLRNSAHLGISFELIVELPIKLKNISNYDVIPNAHVFFIFERHNLFLCWPPTVGYYYTFSS